MTDPAGRILVVEDNVTTARMLRVFLEARGHDVVVAGSGAEAETATRTSTFDLVLLDRMLPDFDGLDFCRALRASSSIPIVLLTARTAEDDVVEGLEAGADDYVTKPFSAKTLIARVHRCLRRASDPVAGSAMLRHGDITLDLSKREVQNGDRNVRLTRSEFDILRYLISSPGRVFTRAQIIDNALGPDFDGFDRTIDTHIWSLRRKLGTTSDGRRVIESEPGIGYRLADVENDGGSR